MLSFGFCRTEEILFVKKGERLSNHSYAYDHRATTSARECHSWVGSAYSGFSSNQLSVWLSLDRWEPRRVTSTFARPRQPDGSSHHEFPRDLSVFCCSCFGGALHEP